MLDYKPMARLIDFNNLFPAEVDKHDYKSEITAKFTKERIFQFQTTKLIKLLPLKRYVVFDIDINNLREINLAIKFLLELKDKTMCVINSKTMANGRFKLIFEYPSNIEFKQISWKNDNFKIQILQESSHACCYGDTYSNNMIKPANLFTSLYKGANKDFWYANLVYKSPSTSTIVYNEENANLIDEYASLHHLKEVRGNDKVRRFQCPNCRTTAWIFRNGWQLTCNNVEKCGYKAFIK